MKSNLKWTITFQLLTKKHTLFNFFRFQASDRDSGENSELVFTLQPQDKFSVNYRSGQVVTAATFHKEAGTIFNMIAKVEDKGGRLGSLSSTAQLVVSFSIFDKKIENSWMKIEFVYSIPLSEYFLSFSFRLI